MSNTQLTVLSILPNSSPSSLLNVDIPLRKLGESGIIKYVSRLEYTVHSADVTLADVIVLCRNIDPIYRPIYELAKRLGIPMIYVLDDDIMSIAEDSESYENYSQSDRVEYYHWMLENVDLVRVHSPTLQTAIENMTDTPTSLVWAPVDWSLTPDTLPELTKPYKIVYAATRETGKQLFQFMEADLHNILQKYPQTVEMHFLGHIPNNFTNYRNVHTVLYERNYENFFRAFTRAGYAIGLAPMLDSKFFRSKTDVKYRDYAAAGAVGIYMGSQLYNASVVDGATGFLVSGEPGSWANAIEKLINNPDLLNDMRHKAYNVVYSKYHMDQVGPMWMSDFNRLPNRPTMTDDDVKLVANTQWHYNNPHMSLPKRLLRFGLKMIPSPLVNSVKKILVLRNII